MNAPPPLGYPPGAPQPPPEILGGLIPRNAQALVAYYCGIFAIIPCIGAILGPVALVFGILGLRTAEREPYKKGKVHAWIGIVTGALFGLVYIGVGLLWLFAVAMGGAKGR